MKILIKGGNLDNYEFESERQLPPGSSFKIPTSVGGFIEYKVEEDFVNGRQVMSYVREFCPEQLLIAQFKKLDDDVEAKNKRFDRFAKIIVGAIAAAVASPFVTYAIIVIIRELKK